MTDVVCAISILEDLEANLNDSVENEVAKQQVLLGIKLSKDALKRKGFVKFDQYNELAVHPIQLELPFENAPHTSN